MDAEQFGDGVAMFGRAVRHADLTDLVQHLAFDLGERLIDVAHSVACGVGVGHVVEFGKVRPDRPRLGHHVASDDIENRQLVSLGNVLLPPAADDVIIHDRRLRGGCSPLR